MIRLENVNKYYEDNHVLKDVSLRFDNNTISVIIGQSGSGKSTLLYTMNRIEKIDSGKIFVNSQDIYSSKVDLIKIRSQVGIVFQQYSLFSHLSVLDNIILAPMRVKNLSKSVAIDQAVELLEKLGMKDRMNSFPLQLSGGEQQRVAIARTLAMETSILLLDEPTNSLDVYKVKEILKIIKDISQKKKMTIIITTHELNFAAEVANRAIFMHKGSVVEEGQAKELLFNPRNQLTKDFINERLDGNFY